MRMAREGDVMGWGCSGMRLWWDEAVGWGCHGKGPQIPKPPSPRFSQLDACWSERRGLPRGLNAQGEEMPRG